jgi:hypothetical protein
MAKEEDKASKEIIRSKRTNMIGMDVAIFATHNIMRACAGEDPRNIG